jgi:recombination protein RecT
MSSGNIVPLREKYNKMEEIVNSPDTLAKIKAKLPNHITEERMARTFLAALTQTPALLDCSPDSLMQAVMEASILGLPTDGILGHGYILPYGEKAKFIPGYRGLIDLARRSGQVNWIQARVVYEDDEFDFEYGLEPKCHHKPVPRNEDDTNDDKVVAFYAAAKLTTGEIVFEVMYRDDIEAIRKRSPAGKRGPWVTDWVEMGRKTVTRKLMKYLPLSTDVQAAVISDEYAEAGLLDKIIEPDIDDGVVDAEAVETLETVTTSMEANEEDAPNFEGKGRISNEEEQAFEGAIQDLVDRAEAETTPDLAVSMLGDVLGGAGYTMISEIRSRADREAVYHAMLAKVVEAEELA